MYLFRIAFMEISWVDIIDIVLVSILLLQAYKLIRGSVAIKVFLGFLSLYLIFLVVRAAQMELLTSILGQFMGVGIIALIILFQQEIRKFLLIIGRTTAFDREDLFKTIGGFLRASTDKLNFTPIIEATKAMAGSNTGALIVVSKNSGLKFYAESGDPIDAIVSKRLLMSIFNKFSPLHDGAVIIFKNRIVAARCILPVTEQTEIPAQFGLRHRAAIGMSEITDTILIVVSEETGQITTVRNGFANHNLSPQELRQELNTYFIEDTEKEQAKEPESTSAPKPEPPVEQEAPAKAKVEDQATEEEDKNPLVELIENDGDSEKPVNPFQ